MELQKLAQTLGRLEAKSCFHSQQVDYYRDYITSCLDNLTAKRWCGGAETEVVVPRQEVAFDPSRCVLQ